MCVCMIIITKLFLVFFVSIVRLLEYSGASEALRIQIFISFEQTSVSTAAGLHSRSATSPKLCTRSSFSTAILLKLGTVSFSI